MTLYIGKKKVFSMTEMETEVVIINNNADSFTSLGLLIKIQEMPQLNTGSKLRACLQFVLIQMFVR